MKLLCINARPIKCWNGDVQYGQGLKEGSIYTTEGVIDDECGKCYLIKELKDNFYGDRKLCIRFEVIEDSWVDELLDSLKAVEETELELV
jgi:hypothetical protein